jgi:GDP-L-fucose synthase
MAAASTGGAEAALTEPYRQVTDNLVMDSLMLEALYFEGVSRIIYLSSATVYQEFDGYIREDDLDWNQNPHASYLGVGWAKRSAEKLCYFWHEKHDMDIIIARCANIYGPYAKFDPRTSNFIPALIRKAVDKIDPFEVWGTPDVSRDVIYGRDLASAVISLLKRTDITYDTFNVGSGEPVTIENIVDLALKHGRHSPSGIVYAENKPTTIQSRVLDCQKIKKTLHWEPVVSVSEGVEQTTQWWMHNKDRWSK